jgi:hypothetical protein
MTRKPNPERESDLLPSLLWAFQAAGLWVSLDWNMPQAVVGSQGHADEAEAAWDKMLKLVSDIEPASSSGGRHAYLLEQHSEWKAGYPGVDPPSPLPLLPITSGVELVYPSIGDLSFLPGSDRSRDSGLFIWLYNPQVDWEFSAKVCQVFYSLTRVRWKLTVGLGRTAKAAWDLGECLARGRCPPDVWGHMLPHLGEFAPSKLVKHMLQVQYSVHRHHRLHPSDPSRDAGQEDIRTGKLSNKDREPSLDKVTEPGCVSAQSLAGTGSTPADNPPGNHTACRPSSGGEAARNSGRLTAFTPGALPRDNDTEPGCESAQSLAGTGSTPADNPAANPAARQPSSEGEAERNPPPYSFFALGALPPEEGWAGKVIAAWTQLSMLGPPPQELVEAVGSVPSDAKVERLVRVVEETAERILSGRESPGRPANRLEFDLENRIITLGGKRFQVELEELYFVKAVAEARGEIRSPKDLKRICKELAAVGRFDRLRNGLRPALREVIESVDRRGYRLKMK